MTRWVDESVRALINPSMVEGVLRVIVVIDSVGFGPTLKESLF
jgi:hypothetical protein